MSRFVDAWVAALQAEVQAVYGYGLLGPYLVTRPQITLAGQCQAAHEALRDETSAALVLAEHDPPPPPADYPSMYPMRMGAVAVRLAITLEQEAASAWRYLYAVASQTSGSRARTVRLGAQTQLIASAVRATRWRQVLTPAAATVAFPGI